jgi:hypothetical protein
MFAKLDETINKEILRGTTRLAKLSHGFFDPQCSL